MLTPGRTPDERAEQPGRLRELAEATAALAATETIAELGDVLVERIAPLVGADLAAVLLCAGDAFELLAARGVAPSGLARWRRFAIAADTPAGAAVRESRPMILSGHDVIDRLLATRGEDASTPGTLVCMPMTSHREPLGVLVLGFASEWDAGQADLDFFAIYAECAAQTVRRIRASDEAATRARRLAFLADASDELAASLDYHVTLQKVAQLAVPDLADWCAVVLLDEDELRSVAVAHKDPGKVEWARRLEERYPPRLDGESGAGRVVRTGVSELHPTITDGMLVAAAVDEEHLRLCRELELHSALVVPLEARGHVLGAITMIRAETPGEYGVEDLAVAEDLAHRAAVAVDNARLHTQAQDVARQLQRAVLPERLEPLPGWQLAAHYQPGHHAEVGGDFYDAVAVSPSRLAVFVGDVMGHGIAAAAAMAGLRAALRAYLSVDPAPDVVVSKMDRMFAQLHLSQLVSLVYAVVDRNTDEMAFVNAGHHSPLVVRGDGSVQLLVTPPARPLGAGGDARLATIAPFRPDDTLLLYTDGLIERRGELIDEGIERLVSRAPVLGARRVAQNEARNVAHDVARDLDAALHALVSQFEQNLEDDVTAIAVRRVEEPSMADQFEVSVVGSDGAVTIVVSGDLDLAGVPALRDAVAGSVGTGVRRLVIDCTALTFIDSSGLGCLVEIRNQASAEGRELVLSNVPTNAARTITIGGLADVLGVEPVG